MIGTFPSWVLARCSSPPLNGLLLDFKMPVLLLDCAGLGEIHVENAIHDSCTATLSVLEKDEALKMRRS